MYREEFRSSEREFYWSVSRVTLAIFVTMLALFVIGFIATGGDLITYKFWAPKRADAERQVYEHTKSYRQGSIQRLGTLCTQLPGDDPSHRAMVNDVIAQEFAEWSTADVPDHLKSCLSSARNK